MLVSKRSLLYKISLEVDNIRKFLKDIISYGFCTEVVEGESWIKKLLDSLDKYSIRLFEIYNHFSYNVKKSLRLARKYLRYLIYV